MLSKIASVTQGHILQMLNTTEIVNTCLSSLLKGFKVARKAKYTDLWHQLTWPAQFFFPTAGHEGSEEQKEQFKPKRFQSAFSALFSQEQLRLHLQPYEASTTSLLKKDLISPRKSKDINKPFLFNNS